ncbi:MAG: nicotinate-nucleotide adenylyltransferase [Gammaproteobacteria bacterium]|nr:nicotinate-nucleotide adenylyltransferase [Gammaproteobacteria bacterium]NIR98791.1 nicotinate-nucleotide adenylyltransferase [Gammaproteobacteria bacterium]NIT64501.1 nicotinate-nucleotide adenylyltransferase [Gammaproteobacteria bacterium]NIV21421.1 nicotinate-nucleotide adenylyltransferase [Gammaproteobacteria bacterium]NIX11291.1 nicotinate-nucleotide adenylyltransferase [Gammaproteobacteria bacterium]
MIGVFGGTFDPVHYGHLRPALELLQGLPFDEVRMIPARRPPHRKPPEAPPQLRAEMLRAAIDGVAGMRMDERELHRDGPSYMVDTLASLRVELGRAPLCLLVGMDAFVGFDQWRQWRRILELAHLVVAWRPGWELPRQGELARALEQTMVDEPSVLLQKDSGHILLYPVTQLDISATQIRETVAAGKSPRFLLPDSALAVVEREGLYRRARAG